MRPANDVSVAVLVPTVTDPMHALLERADVLEGCQKGSVVEGELGSLSTRSRPTKNCAGRSARSVDLLPHGA